MLSNLELPLVEQEIEPSSGGSKITNVNDIGDSTGSGMQIIDHLQVKEEAYEGIVAALVVPLPVGLHGSIFFCHLLMPLLRQVLSLTRSRQFCFQQSKRNLK